MDTEDTLREQDIQFLALLRSATLADLIRLENDPVYNRDWHKAAIGLAIWRVMLR